MYAWVAFHLTDECPVGLAGVHLTACAAVDGKSLYATVLELFGKVGDDEVVHVPA